MPIYKSKKPTKDGRIWYFVHCYKENDKYKNYVSKKFLTKREAEEQLSIYRISLNNAPRTNERTIYEHYIEYYNYQSKRLKKTSLNQLSKIYNNHILPKFKNRTFKSLTIKELELFLNSLNYSQIYKKNIFKYFKALNNWVYKIYDIKTNVFDRLNIPINEKKEMQFFTLEEFNLFIDKIEHLNYKLLFNMLFYCGLRIGETLALTWNDIKNNSIIINKTLTSKIKGVPYYISSPKTTSSNRIIPIPNQVKIVLDEWYNYISKCRGFNKDWFLLRDDEPLKETQITNIKNKACKEARVKQIRIHDFRHSTASLLINAKATPNLVAKYLGHSDIAMTLNTYSHLYENELEKIRKEIEKLQ